MSNTVKTLRKPPSSSFYVFNDTNRLVDDSLLAYAILYHDTLPTPVWADVAKTYNKHVADHIPLTANDLRIYFQWLGDRLLLEGVVLGRRDVLEQVAFGSFTHRGRGTLHEVVRLLSVVYTWIVDRVSQWFR